MEKDLVYEWCSYCDYENAFPIEFKLHKCNQCGKWTMPCALCTEEIAKTCKECPFQVNINNVEYLIVSIEDYNSLFDITDKLEIYEAHHWGDKWVYRAKDNQVYACYKEDTSNYWKI